LHFQSISAGYWAFIIRKCGGVPHWPILWPGQHAAESCSVDIPESSVTVAIVIGIAARSL
jgi:hypothetical protein